MLEYPKDKPEKLNYFHELINMFLYYMAAIMFIVNWKLMPIMWLDQCTPTSAILNMELEVLGQK